jgi:hypothetical protein
MINDQFSMNNGESGETHINIVRQLFAILRTAHTDRATPQH